MVEWEIIEEEPQAAEAAGRPIRRGWRFLLFGAVLVLVALGIAVGLRRVAAQNEARREADLKSIIHLEEQAYRFALPEQAAELALSNAPEEWVERYRSALNGAPAGLPEAEILSLEFRENEALVTLDYGGRWGAVRAYRLENGGWKRSPVGPSWWGESSPYRSDHFTLHLADRDATLLNPDELLDRLEGMRADLLALWPGAIERPVEIQVQPLDLFDPYATGRAEGDILQLAINSPLLAPVDNRVSEDPSRAYQHALTQAVAELIAPTAPPNDAWATFQGAARSTLVRRRTLTEQEQYTALRQLIMSGGPDWSRRSDGFMMDALQAAYLAVGAGERTLVDYAFSPESRRNLNDPVAVPPGTLPLVADRALLWALEALDLSAEQPEIVRGQAVEILEVTGLAPFQARVRLNGLHVIESWTPPAGFILPVAAECLGAGSLMAGNFVMRVDPERPVSYDEPFELTRFRLPLPEAQVAPARWKNFVAQIPASALRLAVTRPGTAGRRLVVVDGSGQDWPLLEVPEGRPIAAHPTLPFFAYLDDGECGPSVTLALTSSGEIERVPIVLEGEGHLVWAENWLFLFDRIPGTPDQEPGWAQSVLFAGAALEQSEPVRRRLPALTWKSMRGYDRDVARLLLEAEDGRLWWLFPFFWPRQSIAAAEPVLAAAPPGAATVSFSPDGRWRLLAETGTNGGSLISIQSLRGEEILPLALLAPGQSIGAVAWSRPPSASFLAAVVGSGGPVPMLRYDLAGRGGWTQGEEERRLEVAAASLTWCGGGMVAYQPQGSDRLLALASDGRPTIETTGTLIWCR